MTTHRAPPATIHAIDQQHHDLRALVERVMQTRDLSRLAPLLEQLRAELATHFALEEGTDGLVETITEYAPRHLRHLERLMDEHQAFLDVLDELIQRCRGLADGPAAVLFADLDQLAKGLREHEVAETSLLTESVLRDLGGGG